MPRTTSACVVLFLTVAATAFGQVPAGPEFHVSTTGYGPVRRFSDVASDTNGNFVVVWWDQAVVMARRYDAAGTPQGPAFSVEASSFNNQQEVASDREGGFAVAWQDTDGSFGGIRARRFDAVGAPVGPSFRINVYTTGVQGFPDVASNASGDLVVVWSGQEGSSYGIFGRRFNGRGDPVGIEFQVNTYTTGRQDNVAVAESPFGDFVVVWTSFDQDGSGYGVFGQRFHPSGLPNGAEFQVNTTTVGPQWHPAVAADAQGNFMVVWTSGFSSDVYGQRFDSAGARRGAEFRINTYTPGPQQFPGVTAEPNGNFIVAWQSVDQDGSSGGVFGQRYDASGATRGGEFRVNTWTTNYQGAEGPSIASDHVGNFVVIWDSELQVNQFDVFAQRFGGIVQAPVVVDGGGNRVFEPGETALVAPSWRNVSGASRAFTGAAASFTGPGAPNDPTYAIVDGSADYGVVPNNTIGSCTATGDCYSFAIGTPSARPVLHWDATYREDLLPPALGHSLTRKLHIGDTYTDVARTSSYYRFVETITHHELTGGCGGGNFCPLNATPREQMSVFVLVAKEGAGYQPPACVPGTEMFGDVPASSPYCRWIEELARRSIIGGCGGGNFCPLGNVSREQMTVFALATKEVAGYVPPACAAGSEMFGDVPASSPYCRWIEELARRSIIGGCGGGNFCPIASVTRQENSVFVTGTFALALY